MATPIASRLTLATRAALLVSVLFIAAFGALAYRALQYFEDRFTTLAGQHQETLLREYASKLSGNMAAAHTTLISAAKIVDQKMLANPPMARDFVEARTFLLSSFPQGLYLVDMAGQNVARAVGSPTGKPRDLLPAEIELAQRTLSTGIAQTSEAFATVSNSHIPLFAMSAPVRGSDGTVIGVMQGSFSLLDKNYAGTLANIKIGINGYLFLTTRDRTMLMHPKPERILAVTAKSGQNIGLDRALEQGFEGTTETVNSTGLHALSTFVPVPGRDWVLAANFPMAEVREPFRRSLREMAGGAAAAALLLFGLVIVIVRRLMRPIYQLTERLEDLGKGVSRTMDLSGSAELDIMAGTFNKMVHALSTSESARLEGERSIRDLNTSLEQRVQQRTLALERSNAELQATLNINSSMQAELVQSERLAALGGMVAGVSHELNTPLGNALLAASTMQFALDDLNTRVRDGALTKSHLSQSIQAVNDGAELVLNNVVRASELVHSFKQSAVDQTTQHRRVFDLSITIEDTLASLRPTFKNDPWQITLDVPRGIEMDSYPGPIGQVIVNLVFNSIRHGFEGRDHGCIRIHARTDSEHTNVDEFVTLEVSDDGGGIAKEHLSRVFDPFFTTKLGKGGSGLGLNIVHGIATKTLRGDIQVQSELGVGTRFVLRIPRTLPNLI
jgi:signal transduction histidine kinase